MKRIIVVYLFLCFSTAVFSQNKAPLFQGSKLLIDADLYKINKEQMALNNGTSIKTSDWNGYLKKLVSGFPASTADSILEGLTLYHYEWDKVERMIRFDADRNPAANYNGHSYICFSGFIKDSKAIPFVKFNYSGSDWIYANRIKLVCDDATFEYDSLKFYTLGTTEYVSEYVLMSYNAEMQDLIPKIINSKETIIRFYGDPIYSDFVVTNRMKLDLKEFMKTIKALQ